MDRVLIFSPVEILLVRTMLTSKSVLSAVLHVNSTNIVYLIFARLDKAMLVMDRALIKGPVMNLMVRTCLLYLDLLLYNIDLILIHLFHSHRHCW